MNFDRAGFVHTMSDMKNLRWNPEKAARLKNDTTRGGISFSDCVIAIDEGRILDNLPHPTRNNQKLLILEIEHYAYVVPYVIEEDGSWFLKTVFPSRQHTHQYLNKKRYE